LSDPNRGGQLTSAEGTITAIDTAASTVTLQTESGQSVTLQLTATTPIEVNHAHTTLAAVQVGMKGEAVLDAQGNVISFEAQTDN
jgi:hypothetical protein